MWLRLAAINGFLAVGAGAFVAHAIDDRLTPGMLVTFQTAARYHMYHAIALLAVALAGRHSRAPAIPVAGWLFLIGIGLFCGSLYARAMTDAGWLDVITPFGGVSLLLGWLALASVPLRPRSRIRF